MHLFRKLTLLSILLFFAACKKEKLYFQKVEVVETNTVSRLNKIKFVNDSLCLIGGGERFHKSEVLRSPDGGYTWSSNTYPEVSKGIYEIDISPAGSIYLSAFDARMLVSRDNAQTWQYKDVGNWEFHVGISHANSNRMIMVSRDGQRKGKIVITDSNIQVLKTIAYEFGLNDVIMLNEKTGYIAAYGALLRTTDGGESWEYVDVKNDNFLTIFALNQNELWVCGYAGSIYRSTDGGQSWEQLRNGNSITIPKYNLQDIIFTDSNNGWAVGEKGLVIRSTDGGKTWTQYNKLMEGALLSIAPCPDGSLLVAGEFGKLYRVHP
jgi:photosystem II stability/assembly factor-like uncharacterized protein